MRRCETWVNDLSTLIEFVNRANNCYDGHFMLLKFTTEYRACFGTFPDTDNMHALIHELPKGATAIDAMRRCLYLDFDVRDIEQEE